MLLSTTNSLQEKVYLKKPAAQSPLQECKLDLISSCSITLSSHAHSPTIRQLKSAPLSWFITIHPNVPSKLRMQHIVYYYATVLGRVMLSNLLRLAFLHTRIDFLVVMRLSDVMMKQWVTWIATMLFSSMLLSSLMGSESSLLRTFYSWAAINLNLILSQNSLLHLFLDLRSLFLYCVRAALYFPHSPEYLALLNNFLAVFRSLESRPFHQDTLRASLDLLRVQATA